MAGRDYRDFVRSVFEPLAEAAGRTDLLDQLSTVSVPDDRNEEQFNRFKTFRIDRSDVVYLPNGGFATLFRHCDGMYVAVSSSGLIADDEQLLNDWAISHDFDSEDLDECTFICLAHHLKGYFRLADRFRAREEALNVIDVVADDYNGHSFDQLFTYYRPVFVFRVPEDSTFYSADIFAVVTDLCCQVPALRSPIIDDDLAIPIRKLSEIPSIANENLFQALTASHFRHAFLELYRCLESIFYLPWMLDLKHAGNLQIRAHELKQMCRGTLEWREKELPSMERLFGLISSDPELDGIEDSIQLFRDLKNAEEFARSQLGKRLYAIRNGMVHHEDYEEPNRYKPNDEEWRRLSRYAALALVRLAETYTRDITPIEKNAEPKAMPDEPIASSDKEQDHSS